MHSSRSDYEALTSSTTSSKTTKMTLNTEPEQEHYIVSLWIKELIETYKLVYTVWLYEQLGVAAGCYTTGITIYWNGG